MDLKTREGIKSVQEELLARVIQRDLITVRTNLRITRTMSDLVATVLKAPIRKLLVSMS